ncbi:MAG TPA: phosphomannomutase, partial [Methylophaga aminisulfidivorans]|nr:phosphomannomutase [Methylophaga aminisulfidivorans]
DGDSDRPLLSDEKGHWLRGDIVGLLTARYLQADIVVTPVSSNSSVDAGFFEQVERTRIGSPYVIAAMQSANQAYPTKKVVGYEANGGFLQQTTMALNDKSLSALPTRDAMMVIISVIMLAKQQGMTISQLNNSMPAIYTSSDRIKNFATEKSQQLLASLLPNNILDKTIVAALFPFMDDVLNTDITDGLRLMFAQDEIIHLRPSGNAPELRCYTEAKTESRAQDLNRLALTAVKNWSPQK